MSTMLEDKGAEYVAAWPGYIAGRIGCPEQMIRDILTRTFPGIEVGALDPRDAKVVIGSAKTLWLQERIKRGDRIEDVTHCRGCGLKLRALYGECDECQ